VLVALVSAPALGQVPLSDPPAYPSSPWRGLLDGDGNPIPCRCRFQGRDWNLGDVVCMSTHIGTVLARCDLIQNNTSWVPSTTPCVTSAIRPWTPARMLARTLALFD